MAVLMRFPDPIAWEYAKPQEVEAMKKLGWLQSSEKERQDLIEAKHKRLNEAAQEAARELLATTEKPQPPVNRQVR